MAPPFLHGAPFPASAGPPGYALDVDFTAFTPGFHNAASFQSQMSGLYPNLTLKRCYTPQALPGVVGVGAANGPGYNAAYTGSGELAGQGETVQTSPSSLLRSASSTQTDIACIGNVTTNATKRGLVIQAPYTNRLKPATVTPNLVYRNITVPGGWSPASVGTQNYPEADSPDGSGTGSTRVTVFSITGDFGPWIDPTGLGGFVEAAIFTIWHKGLSSKQHRAAWESASGGASIYTTSFVGTWERLSTIKNAGSDLRYYYSEDARPSGDLDSRLDYVHLERGQVAREAIPTTGAVRPGERLSYSNGSQLIALDGQFKMYARLSPMFDSTQSVCWDILQSGSFALGTNDYQAAWYLFSWGNTVVPSSYAYISSADRKLHVKIQGGTEYVSNRSMTWSAATNDELEIYIAVGNGRPSIAKWRKTGDPYWNDLELPTVPDAPAPGSNPIAFLHNLGASAYSSDTGQFTCRLHHLSVIRSGNVLTPAAPPAAPIPRITQAGDGRVTQDGNTRIIQ